jgi:hypothetical protein
LFGHQEHGSPPRESSLVEETVAASEDAPMTKTRSTHPFMTAGIENHHIGNDSTTGARPSR